jgi:hypothetical protein
MNFNRSVYQDLLQLDRGMADQFKRAVGDDFAGKVSEGEAKLIFGKALDGSKITQNEAKALVTILGAARFEKGAKKSLKELVKSDEAKTALFDGTSERLTGHQLDPVTAALTSVKGVGGINFRNPAGHQFVPAHYAAVARLITDKKIAVYRMHAHNLNESAGLGGAFHSPSKNRLVVYSWTGTPSWQALVIHEATHAIQDWMDRNGENYLVKYLEADAYTAQAVALYGMGKTLAPDTRKPIHPLNFAFHSTAKLLCDPQAKKEYTPARFKAAYDKLAEVIADYPLYRTKANEPRDFTKKEKGKSEADQFKAVLADLADD